MATSYTSNSPYVKFQVDNMIGLTNRFILEDAHRRSTPITPMKEGHLRTAVEKRVEGNIRGTIQWLAPYAVYQENPRRPFNYTTPGTRAHFAEDSVKGAMDNLREFAMRGGMI